MSRRAALGLLAGAGAGLVLGVPLPAGAATGQRTRKIPSSGEDLPVVGLGTARTFDVGGSPAEREPLAEVLRRFVAAGGTLVDSSPMYGNAERVVGDLLKQLDLNRAVFRATKVWTDGREAGIAQMEESRRLMGGERIDLMQVHNLRDLQTHLATLREWKAAGRIRYVGVTHYTERAYDDLERILKNEKLDFVQYNYSLGEREAEERILPLSADVGTAVLVNKPYLRGRLFRAVKGRPLPGWAEEFDAGSWGQFFLKFILGHPAVTCVLPATSKARHLDDNMGAGLGRLPDPAQRKRMVTFYESL